MTATNERESRLEFSYQNCRVERDVTRLAWRLAKHDGTSAFQKYAQKPGARYSVPHFEDGKREPSSRRILPGHWGYHACPHPVDVLEHGHGLFIERVVLSGLVVWDEDIIAASERTTLWRADATGTLLQTAADAAERA